MHFEFYPCVLPRRSSSLQEEFEMGKAKLYGQLAILGVFGALAPVASASGQARPTGGRKTRTSEAAAPYSNHAAGRSTDAVVP